MGSVSAWEGIFMLVVLKIPLVYLGIVVWWAIRAEPTPDDGPDAVRTLVPLTPCSWDDWRRRRSARIAGRRPFRPTGRAPLHGARAAFAEARRRRAGAGAAGEPA
jgi:hypothetical protein